MNMLILLVIVLAVFLPVTSAFQSSRDIWPFQDDSENDFNGVTVVEDNPRCEWHLPITVWMTQSFKPIKLQSSKVSTVTYCVSQWVLIANIIADAVTNVQITPQPIDGVYRIGDTITCSGLGVSPSFYWTVTSESDMSPPMVPKVASGSNTLKFDKSWVGHIYTLKCTGMNLVAGSTGYISSASVKFSVGKFD